MTATDRQPLANTPATAKISGTCNNRLGTVYSALHSFWASRQAAIQNSGHANAVRRDSYSVILFNSSAQTVISNDFSSQPDQLLDTVLQHRASGGTSFVTALNMAHSIMEQHWSSERLVLNLIIVLASCLNATGHPWLSFCRMAKIAFQTTKYRISAVGRLLLGMLPILCGSGPLLTTVPYQ